MGKRLNRTRVGMIVVLLLFIAYWVWNYRDEYNRTYRYKEIPLSDAGTYVPADQQPKGEGVMLYTLPKKQGDPYPYRYVIWSREGNDEAPGYQKAQFKKTSDAMTVNLEPVTTSDPNQIKADLVVEVESQHDLQPFLIYTDNERAEVKQVTLP